MYNYVNDNKFYEKFKGKTVKVIKQLDSKRIHILFEDDTYIIIYNKGIDHDDIHLTVYES